MNLERGREKRNGSRKKQVSARSRALGRGECPRPLAGARRQCCPYGGNEPGNERSGLRARSSRRKSPQGSSLEDAWKQSRRKLTPTAHDLGILGEERRISAEGEHNPKPKAPVRLGIEALLEASTEGSSLTGEAHLKKEKPLREQK